MIDTYRYERVNESGHAHLCNCPPLGLGTPLGVHCGVRVTRARFEWGKRVGCRSTLIRIQRSNEELMQRWEMKSCTGLIESIFDTWWRAYLALQIQYITCTN